MAMTGWPDAISAYLAAGGCANDAGPHKLLLTAALQSAVMTRDFKSAKLLIAAGATVDSAPKGLTPLCRAALLGDLRVLQMLFEAGGSINISSAGDAPLIAAATRGRTVCVDLLLRGGADVHVRERRFERSTPLHSLPWTGAQL
eukprot:15818-Heterococcus_DN1.PRE.2